MDRDDTADLPPAAKWIHTHLKANGPTRRRVFRDELGLKKGTIDDSVTRLIDRDLVDRRKSATDGRETVYFLRADSVRATAGDD